MLLLGSWAARRRAQRREDGVNQATFGKPALQAHDENLKEPSKVIHQDLLLLH